MKIYSEEIRIKSYHVDKNGKLSAEQVLKFLQEAAFQHSVFDKFGQPDLDSLGMVWMLSRLKVIFIKEVLIGESIEINSWVRSIKGAISERDFVLIHNGDVIVKATSLWVCLDAKSIRPVSIPEAIKARMNINLSTPLVISTSKISALNGDLASSIYRVQPSDIDMVNHTNNVAYVRMALNMCDSNRKLAAVDVNYLNQSFEGDVLTIANEARQSSQMHEISNEKAQIICRINCLW